MTFTMPRQLLPRQTMFVCALALGSMPARAGSPVAATALDTAVPGTLTDSPWAGGSSQAAPSPTEGMARTRFVIGLDKAVDFKVFALTDPHRVIVDVPSLGLRLPADTGGRTIGLINSFRSGMAGPGRTRVVIEVSEPVVVASQRVERAQDGRSDVLAVEIVSAADYAKSAAAKKTFLKASPVSLGAGGLQPPLPLPALSPGERAARAFKPVIVIDPGHGGHDSGAMKNGTVEKEVVLAFSQVLRKKLEATGRYRVMMTRETDVFVELGERVRYAERNKANLFIAVHADYAGGNSQARGATIYSLRDSVAKSLSRSARGDVASNVLSGSEVEKVKAASVDGDLGAVKNILVELAERELDLNKERTSVFSRGVVELMGGSTGMRHDPDKQAGFRVLKTAQFPSVLIELGYVTNKEDAELLRSDAWRDKVSDSIMGAVETYFGNQIARLPM